VSSSSASGAGALQLAEANGVIGTISDNVIHACYNGIVFDGSRPIGTVSNTTCYRNVAFGIGIGGGVNHVSSELIKFSGGTLFGNASGGVAVADKDAGGNIVISNFTLNAGVTHTQPYGYQSSGPKGVAIRFESCSFGATTPHATGDLNITNSGMFFIQLFNCILASSTEVANTANLRVGFVISIKHDQGAGSHKAWLPNGRTTGATMEPDTAIVGTTSPSARLYPGSLTLKLVLPRFYAAVANGNTLTPSIKVRESIAGDGTDYNGTRIRLIVLANVAAGISANTVLATATGASEGAFETLSGTTAAVTDDAVLEFIVDCDGTTGWINIDDFSCVSENPGGTKNWAATLGGPGMWGVPAGGGGLMSHRGMVGGILG
jgi:hypothetical protein